MKTNRVHFSPSLKTEHIYKKDSSFGDKVNQFVFNRYSFPFSSMDSETHFTRYEWNMLPSTYPTAILRIANIGKEHSSLIKTWEAGSTLYNYSSKKNNSFWSWGAKCLSWAFP